MVSKIELSSRDRRRQSIISIAKAIFLKEGYGAASMSHIAAEVGGSKATLYAYFKGKTDLFAAVVESISGEFSGDAITADLARGDLRDDLLRTGLRLIAFIRQPETMAMQRLVIGEAERFPELGQVFFETGPRQKLNQISSYLQKAMDEGRLRRADPISSPFAGRAGITACCGMSARVLALRKWNRKCAPRSPSSATPTLRILHP